MKYNLLLFLFIAMGALQAQVNTLPVPSDGDTIMLINDMNPGPLDLGSTGADQVWNFQLSGMIPLNTLVTEVMQDSSFPSANRIFNSGFFDVYYDVNAQAWSQVGLTGDDPLGFGFTVLSIYSTPLADMRAPLNFPDNDLQSSRLVTNIPLELIPDSILNLLPLVPDSLRVAVATLRNDVVDASGSLTLNGETYDVLRQMRTDITQVIFEAKISILPWSDVTSLILPFLPDGIELLDTAMSYRFLADEMGTPVAEVLLDTDTTVQSVNYVGDGVVASIREIVERSAEIKAYPNPSRGVVQLFAPEGMADVHIVQAFDLSGRQVPVSWSHSNHNILAEINSPVSGQVAVVLRDRKGKVLAQKSIILID